ncbi:hypothetical protein GGQ74_001254 [Desulfobaculum xiamenense]|uniref:Uncharacterized protein n=1 Tax=Desulfobaculum xiamenense TaxID=995050 RepID=A0A846QQY4_9BACT|nr:hypothetical protein [Desulfobaculum xiamenense]NJB67614.1 hypothetical protein [Desulfobaculum xiamenense]
MGREFDELADGLVQETLVEAANTFFGARKNLDEEIEAYRKAADDFAAVEAVVLRKAGALNYLLLEGRAVADFYTAIGVSAPHLVDMPDPAVRDTDDLEPLLVLTTRGRYVGLVLNAYSALASEVEAYLHGRYYNASDGSGRKLITPNYSHLHKWCGRLNEKIRDVNENHSPSGTLCFVKGLDASLLERQRLSGATFDNYCQELDEELKFKPVECLGMNYIHPPDLPELRAVKRAVTAFARSLYAAHRDEVKRLLTGFATPSATRHDGRMD